MVHHGGAGTTASGLYCGELLRGACRFFFFPSTTLGGVLHLCVLYPPFFSAGKPTFIVPFFGDQPFWGAGEGGAGGGIGRISPVSPPSLWAHSMLQHATRPALGRRPYPSTSSPLSASLTLSRRSACLRKWACLRSLILWQTFSFAHPSEIYPLKPMPEYVRACMGVVSRCQRNATRVQGLMQAEDGIQGAVDHLHRTIYGALIEGKTFQWMKAGPLKV